MDGVVVLDRDFYCCDFDGTIHNNVEPWPAIGGPIEGAIDFLYAVAEEFYLYILSARASTPAGTTQIINALTEWGFVGMPYRVSAVKPPAVQYLDDLGRHFSGPGDYPTVEEIRAFHAWNKTGPGSINMLASAVTPAALVARAAERAEQTLTFMVERAVGGQGGYLAGMQHRLKDASSIEGKVKLLMQQKGWGEEQAADDIKDAVRYTAVYEEPDYTVKTEATLAALARLGFTVERVRDYWTPGVDPSGRDTAGTYVGVNAVLACKTGFRFEVQFHTPASLIDQQLNWDSYRLLRQGDLDGQARRETIDRMRSTVAQVPVPPGAEAITASAVRYAADLLRLAHFSVVPADAHYRPADEGGPRCGTCSWYDAGVCRMYDAPVEDGYVCDNWEAATPTLTAASRPVTVAHHNDVLERGYRRAEALIPKLADLLAPIFVQAGEEAASTFERLAAKRTTVTGAAGKPFCLPAELRGVTDPVRQEAIKLVAQTSLEGVGLSFDVENPFIAKALAASSKHIAFVSKTTQIDVMKAVRASYKEGLTVSDTATAIRSVMKDASQARATLIARTELSGAVNAGSLAATQIVSDATGDTYYKQWLTAPGARYPRHETYDDLDGQTVNLDDTFDVGGEQLDHPGDPNGDPSEVCNCRCAMSYTDNADELTASGGLCAPATPLYGDRDIAAEALGGLWDDILALTAAADPPADWTPPAADELLNVSCEAPGATIGMKPGQESGLWAKEWEKALTPEERQAIIDYREVVVGDLGQLGNEIRAVARGASGSEEAKAKADLVAQAVEKSQTPKDITTWRGESDSRHIFEAAGVPAPDPAYEGNPLDELQPLVGKRFTLDGFTSTSQSRAQAERFAYGDAMLRIESPAGTTIARLGGVADENTPTHEVEYLLGKDARVEVTKVSISPDGLTQIDLRVLPPDVPVAEAAKAAATANEPLTVKLPSAYKNGKAALYLPGNLADEWTSADAMAAHTDPSFVKALTDAGRSTRADGALKVYLTPSDVKYLHGEIDSFVRAWSEAANAASVNADRRRFNGLIKSAETLKDKLEPLIVKTDQPFVPVERVVGDQMSAMQAATFDEVHFAEPLASGLFPPQFSTSAATAAKTRIMRNLAADLKDTPGWDPMAIRDTGYWGAYGDTPDEDAVSALISNWANTSGDHNPLAIAIQKAAAQEFGVADTTTYEALIGEGQRATLDRFLADDALMGSLRAFVRAQYNATQALFRERGITELYVSRGLGVDDVAPFLHLPKGALYREGALEITSNPLSSWTINNDIAQSFAMEYSGGGTEVLLFARVPADRVLSLPTTGFGCTSEQEVVVLGKAGDTATARLLSSYWSNYEGPAAQAKTAEVEAAKAAVDQYEGDNGYWDWVSEKSFSPGGAHDVAAKTHDQLVSEWLLDPSTSPETVNGWLNLQSLHDDPVMDKIPQDVFDKAMQIDPMMGILGKPDLKPNAILANPKLTPEQASDALKAGQVTPNEYAEWLADHPADVEAKPPPSGAPLLTGSDAIVEWDEAEEAIFSILDMPAYETEAWFNDNEAEMFGWPRADIVAKFKKDKGLA